MTAKTAGEALGTIVAMPSHRQESGGASAIGEAKPHLRQLSSTIFSGLAFLQQTPGAPLLRLRRGQKRRSVRIRRAFDSQRFSRAFRRFRHFRPYTDVANRPPAIYGLLGETGDIQDVDGILPNHTNGYTKHDNDDRERAQLPLLVVWCEAYLRCGALTTLGEEIMAAKKAAKKPAKKAAKKKAAKKKK